MSVPNTTTFDLKDVTTELGLSSNSSLQECFSVSSANGFDSSYAGSKNGLLNFRNYSNVTTETTTRIVMSNTGTSTLSNACSVLTTSVFRYFRSTASYPRIGDIIYSDSNLNFPMNGLNDYFKFEYTTGTGSYLIRVSAQGQVVSSIALCS
ncbi:hypothetical protein Calle1_16 [Cellulophaga phage Calle_1]|uniref:Uncharacterized protein n=1 Tax=Cellulophaga phage Calle_1 TaxID=2745643 RepID=A0A8E4ZED5_9CAUD|nr:hypothetical protein M1M22_gp016 [Cellulophaga phage Calle_1]QQV89714.1 hypothetical protein Calle1_16 [Cellulophaga phage Calle_1]QQV89790.1 hypothetical protein Calle2_16 [Cellulophaga phage Calle_2]QQV89929.1 hypothetical protein Calle3_16 [Cellulophaga phage Calle_3]